MIVAATGTCVRADELAAAIFGLLGTRSPADRRVVHLALQRALVCDAGASRQERVVSALRHCAEEVGHAPSRREWDAWRAAQPRPQDWPSAATIRNAFGGSWSRARTAAGGEPTPDVLVKRLVAQGGSYTDAEMIDALVRAEAALGWDELTFEAYVRWARAQPPGRSGGLRVPRSGKPFRRRWGSWAAALRAAHPSTRSGSQRARAWGRAYTTAEMRSALRQASDELACGGGLTYGQYDRWAIDFVARSREHGGYDDVPRAATIARTFGSWARALQAAELLTEDAARQRAARVGARLDDTELVDWVVAARVELGRSPSRTDYVFWRRERVTNARPDQAVPPSEATIRLRLGGWDAANALADRRLRGLS